MLPTTNKLHLKVFGNTKKFGERGAVADQEMRPWWSIISSIRGLYVCLQKLISSAPRNNYKHIFVVNYKISRNYKEVRVGA